MDYLLLYIVIGSLIGTITVGTVATSLYLWKVKIMFIFPKEANELDWVRALVELAFLTNLTVFASSVWAALWHFHVIGGM